MTLREIIDRLLGRQQASATTAKHRLQLVLAHDRSDLNPDLMEQMRREILEVVNRYVELDLEGGDVSLETEERATALVWPTCPFAAFGTTFCPRCQQYSEASAGLAQR